MRALLRGERQGSPGVLLGLLALALAFLTLLLLVWVQSARLAQECQQRRAYDASSQHTRAVFRAYYLEQIRQERANPYIEQRLRDERVQADRELLGALDDTLGKTVVTTCGGLL